MNKLLLNGQELVRGDWLFEPFERGSIVHINFEDKEVYVFNGKEGWTLSEENGNLEGLQFVVQQ